MSSKGEPEPLERLAEWEVRDEGGEVWRVCRNCGSEIPPSRRNMAYCDHECKEALYSEETGFTVETKRGY